MIIELSQKLKEKSLKSSLYLKHIFFLNFGNFLNFFCLKSYQLLDVGGFNASLTGVDLIPFCDEIDAEPSTPQQRVVASHHGRRDGPNARNAEAPGQRSSIARIS